MTGLSRGALASYAVVALPLAAGALPLYIHVASIYSESFGAPLAGIGIALLAARAADALVDPWLGILIDRLRRPRLVIVAGIGLLALGLVLVFHPPWRGTASLAWLMLSLLPAYLGYSSAAIAHLALGASFGATSAERARVAVWREGFGLVGILLAAAAPQFVASDAGAALAQSSLVFAAVAPLGVALALSAIPSIPGSATAARPAWTEALRQFGRAPFAPLLAAFFVNGVANALPATLALLFVADVLGAPQFGAQFLLAYFAGGAIGLPAWLALARRLGSQRAWQLSMVLGAAAFVGATALGPGDLLPFLAVCIASGLMLGGDLALPAALLTDALRERGRQAVAASYFGLWTLATKLTLAVAAGIGLPLVSALGYVPGQPQTAGPLQLAYCLLPCALKVIAAGLLPLTLRPRPQGALP